MPEILAITDFSDSSTTALQYAAALATDAGYALRIVHAFVVPMVIGDPIVQPMPLMTVNDMRGIAIKKMDTLVAQLQTGFPGLAISQQLTYGDWEEAATDGEANNAALIIVGNDADDSFWLGSETGDAALNFNKPVLVLPAHTSFHSPKKLCLACDASALENLVPLLNILPFLKKYKVALELLHVRKDSTDTARWNESRLSEVLEGVAYSFYEHEAGSDSIDKATHDFAQERRADWLGLIPHHYSFFQGLFHKSHTKAAFRMGDVPVLCLH